MTEKISARAARRGREQRLTAKLVPTIEVRTAGDGSTDATLSGYACVTGSGYQISDMFGSYTEVVRSGAFKDTLAANDDVRLLINHDGIALARTKSGTMTLREITNPADDPLGTGTTGLWCEASLDPTSGLVNDLRSAMTRGDIDEMSFAFQVTDQEWSPDFSQRDITALKLFDVSAVTYPANPATSASMRSLDETLDGLSDDDAKRALSLLTRRLYRPQIISLTRAQSDALDLLP